MRTGETPVLPGRVDNLANSRSGVSPDMKESLNLGIINKDDNTGEIMKVTIKTDEILSYKTKCLVVGCYMGEKIKGLAKDIDRKLGGAITNIIKDKDFEGKIYQTTTIYTLGRMNAERIILVGLGKEKGFSLERLRMVAGASSRLVRKLGINRFSTTLCTLSVKKRSGVDVAQAVTEGAILSLYNFDDYKTEKRDEIKKMKEIILLISPKGDIKEIKRGVNIGRKISQSVSFVRDLVSQPGNTATPTFLAKHAKRIAKESNIKCKILKRSDMERLGMGAILGVAKGSDQPPMFIILEYKGDKKNNAPIVLVGKGLTFDSGGLSLKSSAGMGEMKDDMSGGAAVMGTVQAAAALKLPVNLVGLVPATENLPSGKAIKPGDILRSMSGKTIEVTNTDAEGRLILADALTYAERYNPRVVIDIATLTYACVIALGNNVMGIMGNDDKLQKGLKKAGEVTGERVWKFPLWDEYSEQIKSSIADMKNTGGGSAGTITAAAFLKKFASKYKWAHLDIAGVAWEKKGKPYIPKGASGVSVRLLIQYLRDNC